MEPENPEDAYFNRHYTGHIPSSAYARDEQPGHLHGREKEDVTLGQMEIEGEIDPLAGTEPVSGKPYRELFRIAHQIRTTVDNIIENGQYEVYTDYPVWFKRVWFTVDGKGLECSRLSQDEVDDRRSLTLRMAAAIANAFYPGFFEGVAFDKLLDWNLQDDAGTGTGKTVITFRKSSEKLKYYNREEERNYTDEEIEAMGLPQTETTVSAYDGPNRIGYACNEFGAVGVFVSGNYQRKGIGKELLKLYQAQWKKEQRLGQMTNAGVNLTRSYYRKHVKPASESVLSIIAALERAGN